MVYSYSYEDQGVQLIPLPLRDQLLALGEGCTKNGKYLNLGCGKEYYKEPGWINLDGCTDIKADKYCDLDQKDLEMPFENAEFDMVWASHIFEHIWYLGALKKELARIIKLGGQLTFIVPYYLFQDAWGDDTHCRAFSESSFAGCFWPGFDIGIFGQLPTINNAVEGEPQNEFWLWSTKKRI
jgi:SAM-dependent methyltransferase